jgi:hypothetical protein
MRKTAFLLLLILLCSCNAQKQDEGINLETGFKNPPMESRPHVWWHWLDGHISKEGITNDIAAMAAQGIGGATILNVGISTGDFHDKKPTYDYMTTEWKALVTHAFSEAKRYGIRVSLHDCDGWSHTGGTWITPQQAMKKITFSKTFVKGGETIKQQLPLPPSILNFYRDVTLLAYPATDAIKYSMYSKEYVVASNTASEHIERAADGNIISAAKFTPPEDRSDYIELLITFEKPFAATTLAISDYLVNQNESASTYQLQYSADGRSYNTITDLIVSGPKGECKFKEVSAKYFKLILLHPPRKGFEKEYIYFHEFELLSHNANATITKINDFGKKSSNWIRRRDYLPSKPLNEEWVINRTAVLDISEHLSEDGMLTWDAPEGQWEIIRLGYTATGRTNSPATEAGKGLECDKMNASHIEAFFKGGPQILADESREFIGESFTHFLTDSWEAYCANWTEDFLAEFNSRRGYDMTPYLPVLCDEVIGSVEESERFLWDFRRTIADLYRENCYTKMQDLCRENGLDFQAEASGAQQNMMDPINYPSVVDKPMTEFWVQPNDAHPDSRLNGAFMGAVASAHLYDKKVIAAEAFTSSRGNWRHAPYNLKKAGDQAYALGINMVYFHDYAHQPDESKPGWQMVPWGIAMNRKLTWWEMGSPYFDYLGRCQYLLQQGSFVGDVLAFMGEGAGATSYLAYPYESKNYESKEMKGRALLDLARNLTPKGYAWDACNSETVMERLTVKDGRLVLPHGASYEILMLPESAELTPELLRSIKRLVTEGATLYAPKPKSSPSLKNYPQCDDEVKQLADEIWGISLGENIENTLGKGKVFWGMSLKEVLNNKGVQPDFEYNSPDGSELEMMYLHRQLGSQDLYFVSNQLGETVTINGTFRVEGKVPEIWNPENGEIEPCDNYQLKSGHVSTSFEMAPYGAMFIVFREDTRINNWSKPNTSQEIETISVAGDWKVRFPEGWGAPEEVVFSQLSSWHTNAADGIKYFSGIASYEKELVLPQEFIKEDSKYFIDLGQVYELAEVFVNGEKMGTLWKSPYKVNITEALNSGSNSLKIRVANHWVNRLIGDELGEEEDRFTEPITRMHYDEESEQTLLPSGLIGPVVLSKISDGMND